MTPVAVPAPRAVTVSGEYPNRRSSVSRQRQPTLRRYDAALARRIFRFRGRFCTRRLSANRREYTGTVKRRRRIPATAAENAPPPGPAVAGAVFLADESAGRVVN